MAYDDQNVFARILREEIQCDKVYEDEWALAFRDINPQAAVHVLVIPKGPFTSFDDFSSQASNEQISGYVRALGTVARKLGVADSGYRLLANHGADAHQEVPHFHTHVFAGQDLGAMIRVRR
jgi:diadenosine tetraphosphate (Ap4A) HIT family hydrolase